MSTAIPKPQLRYAPKKTSAPARCSADPIGYWKETIAVPYDRHETIYSAPNYRIGLARTPGSSIESMTTNGYFGAARDRIPISAIDPLERQTRMPRTLPRGAP